MKIGSAGRFVKAVVERAALLTGHSANPIRTIGGAPGILVPAALFLVALAAWTSASPAAAPRASKAPRVSDEECLECHTGGTLEPRVIRGEKVSLDVDAATLKRSAHAKLHCVECHVGFDPEATPHRARTTPVSCGGCHEAADSTHAFHAPATNAKVRGGTGKLTCKTCHGTHDVPTEGALTSATGAKAVNAGCAPCHETEVRHYEHSAHGRAAAAGQKEAPTCIGCHKQAITAERNGGENAHHKLEQEKLCLDCHLDDPAVRERVGPKAGFIKSYETSIHSAELRKGNAKAATCIDCHGAHEMAKGYVADAKTEKFHIPATCGRCHEKVDHAFEASVHGKAVAAGNVDAPVCTDCHGEHTIKKADAPDSPVAPGNVSTEVCSPCHSSVRLAAKYGIRSDRFKTFSDSFHGLAIRGGQISAANCASCHGSHDILPSSDPRSLIYPATLAKTCGKCHPGATAAFATGKVHLEMASSNDPLLYWIATIYTILIVVVVGGMFLHNAVDFYRKARHKLRVRRGLEHAHEPESSALYVRMTGGERIQHASLLVSFVVLVVTGFMLRYPEAWWVDALRRVWHNLFEARSVVHRVAGVVMVTASIVHIYYLAFTVRGRGFLRDMLPRPSDLGDVVGALRYYAGLQRERPRFGRFSYIEKAEYWALVWGTVVMAGTGVILWFQDPAIGLLGKLGWDAARSIHYYEAILATLAIIVWHLYFVIFNPDVYPMNVAWLKGTITEEEMEDEHPLELEAIRRKKLEAEEARRSAKSGRDGGDA
ncbi:MAG TPA: cytochrome b/b6 domain-containing protein [Candidatus Eisenbacteria bacterium]|nr:cytochrome b/b6 domain-containing protein [Candidatus Eisenbacteria bacterium]